MLNALFLHIVLPFSLFSIWTHVEDSEQAQPKRQKLGNVFSVMSCLLEIGI